MKNDLLIEFLGTGTSVGIPMIGCTCPVCTSSDPKDKRLRTSLKIQSKQTTIVIDTTPDFRYQMLRSKTTQIDAILITHSHKDHLAGLDDIRPYNYINHAVMPIYTNLHTIQAIKNEYFYAFQENIKTSVPSMNLIDIDDTIFKIKDIEITPIRVIHNDITILGFRFNNFTYITDASKIEDSEKEKIYNSDVLVLNALRIEPHPAHLTLNQAIELALELKIKKVYFTHISHQLGLYAEIEKKLPKNIHLAYDQLSFRV